MNKELTGVQDGNLDKLYKTIKRIGYKPTPKELSVASGIDIKHIRTYIMEEKLSSMSLVLTPRTNKEQRKERVNRINEYLNNLTTLDALNMEMKKPTIGDLTKSLGIARDFIYDNVERGLIDTTNLNYKLKPSITQQERMKEIEAIILAEPYVYTRHTLADKMGLTFYYIRDLLAEMECEAKYMLKGARVETTHEHTTYKPNKEAPENGRKNKYSSKITEDNVTSIKELLRKTDNKLTKKQVAEQLGISMNKIKYYINNKYITHEDFANTILDKYSEDEDKFFRTVVFIREHRNMYTKEGLCIELVIDQGYLDQVLKDVKDLKPMINIKSNKRNNISKKSLELEKEIAKFVTKEPEKYLKTEIQRKFNISYRGLQSILKRRPDIASNIKILEYNRDTKTKTTKQLNYENKRKQTQIDNLAKINEEISKSKIPLTVKELSKKTGVTEINIRRYIRDDKVLKQKLDIQKLKGINEETGVKRINKYLNELTEPKRVPEVANALGLKRSTLYGYLGKNMLNTEKLILNNKADDIKDEIASIIDIEPNTYTVQEIADIIEIDKKNLYKYISKEDTKKFKKGKKAGLIPNLLNTEERYEYLREYVLESNKTGKKHIGEIAKELELSNSYIYSAINKGYIERDAFIISEHHQKIKEQDKQ